MNPTFKAAASYFGLPADQVIDGEIADVWGEDITVLTVKIKLTAHDKLGISVRSQAERGARMEGLVDQGVKRIPPDIMAAVLKQLEESVRIQERQAKEQGEIGAAVKQMAEQFDRVSSGGTVIMVDIDGDIKTVQKMADSSKGILSQPTPVGDVKRDVKHVDALYDEVGMPTIVWLSDEEATDAQKRFATETHHDGVKQMYAVNAQMLTPDQRKEAGLP